MIIVCARGKSEIFRFDLKYECKALRNVTKDDDETDCDFVDGLKKYDSVDA